MNREQVKEVFKLLKYSYPQFEVTTDKLDMWTRLLKDQNPATVMKNTERYVLNNKFPPSLADLREKKVAARDTSFIEKVKQWERESVGDKPRSRE